MSVSITQKGNDPVRSNIELRNTYSQFNWLSDDDKKKVEMALFHVVGQEKMLADLKGPEAYHPFKTIGEKFPALPVKDYLPLIGSDLARAVTDQDQDQDQDAAIGDSVVHTYLQLVCKDLGDNSYRNRASTISPSLVTKIVKAEALTEEEFKSVTSDGQHFSKTTMHIWPLQIDNKHWAAYFVFPTVRKLFYYNSLGETNYYGTHYVLDFLMKHHAGDQYRMYHISNNILPPHETSKSIMDNSAVLLLSYATSFAYGFACTDITLGFQTQLSQGLLPYSGDDDLLGRKKMRILYELLFQQITPGTYGFGEFTNTARETRVLKLQPGLDASMSGRLDLSMALVSLTKDNK